MTSLLLPPPQSNLHVPQIITHFSLDKTRVTITMPLFSGFPLFSLKKFPNFSSISGHFTQTFFPQWFKTTNDVHVYLMLYQTKYCTETRMHSSRMRTVRSLPHGGLPNRDPPWTKTPLGRDPPKTDPPQKVTPWTEIPPHLDKDPHLDRDSTPGQKPPRPPLVMWPVVHAGTETPPNRITDRCKNITLPQLCCGR